MFVVILALLILSHEFGHFIVAKKLGVRVDEFGLGFPPRLASFRRGETVYSLNWLPFGGFVKIFGENPDTDSLAGPDSQRSLINKPKWARAAVLAGGVFFNFLLAWLLISLGLATVGMPTAAGALESGQKLENVRLLITSVLPDSPAAQAGLAAGDEIRGARSDAAQLDALTVGAFQTVVAGAPDEVMVTYRRQEKDVEIVIHPARGLIDDRPAIGVGIDEIGTLRLPIIQAIASGGRTTGNLMVLTTSAFGDFFARLWRGAEVLSSVTGPVGLVGLVGEASGLGLAYLLSFTALISINLGILNLLPFPALDGGRLFFLLIEAIKGSPIRPALANAFNLVGFALLLLLMLAVTYSDIIKLLV